MITNTLEGLQAEIDRLLARNSWLEQEARYAVRLLDESRRSEELGSMIIREQEQLIAGLRGEYVI